MDDKLRQTGRTTKQMLAAPPGAVYVWCNTSLGYPRNLARALCRHDLVVVGPNWLNTSMRGMSPDTHVVFDHAFWGMATREQQDGARYAHLRFKVI
jgi:hypothetical protein